MSGSVVSGLVPGSALIERCPRCVSPEFIAPLRKWRRDDRAVAVYECGCGHAWFTSYNTAALGAGWGAEPVRIGDAL